MPNELEPGTRRIGTMSTLGGTVSGTAMLERTDDEINARVHWTNSHSPLASWFLGTEHDIDPFADVALAPPCRLGFYSLTTKDRSCSLVADGTGLRRSGVVQGAAPSAWR